jgi:hypothetical protein
VSQVAEMLFRDSGVTVDEFAEIIDRACAYESRYFIDRLDSLEEKFKALQMATESYQQTIYQLRLALEYYKRKSNKQ